MKIGLLTSVPMAPPWDQGDKNLAYSLTQALPHLQFQVMGRTHEQEPLGENLELLPVFTDHLPALLQKAGWFSRMIGRSILHNRQTGVDLYHMVFQPTRLSGGFLRHLPELRRKPLLQTVPAIAQVAGFNIGLFFGDRVVVLSDFARQKLADHGVKHLHHIPAGVDFERWRKIAAHSSRLKQMLGFGSAPVILYPGHFSTGYGLDTLLAALPCILTDIPSMQLVLACRMRTALDWKMEALVRQKLAWLELSDVVRILHVVPNMAEWIGASDLVVLPFENMQNKVDIPTTLLEALSAAKPVVISDIAPMNELIHLEGRRLHPQSVGVTVPPGDACALAEAIIELLAAPRLQQELGHRGQELVSSRYDIRQVAAQYENLYQELLS